MTAITNLLTFAPLLLYVLLQPLQLATTTEESIYRSWLGHETRPSPDHWTLRDEWEFRHAAAGDTVTLTHLCRSADSSGPALGLIASSRVKFEPRQFTVLFSEDETISNDGMTCTLSLHKGTYAYELSPDGETMKVSRGNVTETWRRHDNGRTTAPPCALTGPEPGAEQHSPINTDSPSNSPQGNSSSTFNESLNRTGGNSYFDRYLLVKYTCNKLKNSSLLAYSTSFIDSCSRFRISQDALFRTSSPSESG